MRRKSTVYGRTEVAYSGYYYDPITQLLLHKLSEFKYTVLFTSDSYFSANYKKRALKMFMGQFFVRDYLKCLELNNGSPVKKVQSLFI